MHQKTQKVWKLSTNFRNFQIFYLTQKPEFIYLKLHENFRPGCLEPDLLRPDRLRPDRLRPDRLRPDLLRPKV